MRIVTCFIFLIWSVCARSQNLVTNGDFDDGLNGWLLQTATALINTVDGLPNQPSAQLTTEEGNSGKFLSNCIGYDPAVLYEIRANARVLDGATSFTLVLEAYSDATCSVFADFGSLEFESGFQTTWQSFPASLVDASQFTSLTPPVPTAVRAGFHFGGGATGSKSVLVDHIDFRIQGSTPVRLQSFGVD